MTTTTASKSEPRFLGLPKNRTGLFAADTIHEVKHTRNLLNTVPPLSPQFRQNASTNILFASAEQNHHQLQQYRSSNNEIQQYYPLDKAHDSVIDSSNDSRSTSNGIRNGFRPSAIRHPKLRLTTTTTQRTNPFSQAKDRPPKSTLNQSHGSVKLRSEIDHINKKLIKNKEPSKTVRLQNSRELDDTSPSALSYANSYRGSSASTHFTADRIHQRFSSAITHCTTTTRQTGNTTSDQTFHGLVASTPPLTIQETEENETDSADYRPKHAYQIPQQSNVGSESIFLADSPPMFSKKIRSAKYSHGSNETKSVSCPFYVMYLTNLTMQQRDNKENHSRDKQNDRRTFVASSTSRKVPVNSRMSTANSKRLSNRRQVNSPMSLYTYSTLNDDDGATNFSSIPCNKRFSNRIPLTENENSYLLRDLLRTSSWNHVQM